jgi:small subunit ribosomal protein S16
MAVVIRLQRVGKKNRPMFRIVAIEKSVAAKGKPVEVLGIYDPIKKNGKLNFEKYESWVKNGALVSESMKNIYKRMLKNKKIEKELVSSITSSSSS